MKLITALRVIILDFDGVILESEGCKDLAFESLFAGYPLHLEEIMAYRKTHGAVVRFDKFKHITEEILKLPYTEDLKREYSERFSSVVIEQTLRCPFVHGAKEFLDEFYGKIPLYLASVNPAADLNRILSERHLKKYFKDVYTTPVLKRDAIADILRREKCLANHAVFIGDSPEDAQAAEEAGIPFIGRMGTKSLRGARAPMFKDLREIKDYLHSLSE